MTIYDYNEKYTEARWKSNNIKLAFFTAFTTVAVGLSIAGIAQTIRKPEIVSPLPTTGPIHITPTVTLTPRPKTEQEILNELHNAEILHKVYTLESSKGKNDGCKRQGKYNGFGFGQNKRVWNCFDSFDIVAAKVDAWFTRELQTKTLKEALCYYNIGQVTEQCEYAEKFQKA